MCSLKLSPVFTLLFLNIFSVVNAGLYVVQPLQGSDCRASKSCNITWLDDGRAPLLSAIGVSTVGLYTRHNFRLVQTLSPVNVSTERSLTFTPIPEAGPKNVDYYIIFTSTMLKVNDSSYSAYSPYFQITGMSGSLDTPLPAAVSTKPIPSSLTQLEGPSSTSTIIVGTLYTTPSLQPVTTSTTPISSPTPRFTTSVVPSSPSSSSPPPPPSSSSSSISSPSSTAQSRAVGLTTSSVILLPSSLLISILLSWFLPMLYS